MVLPELLDRLDLLVLQGLPVFPEIVSQLAQIMDM